MYANYHTHTSRCKHAIGEDREYVEAAIRSGMKVLGFSDHCPWVYDNGYVSGCRMVPAQLNSYFDSILMLKNEYKNDIHIYAGFEAEYIPECMDAQNKLLKDYPIDYMILGQHFLAREPYSPYTGAPTDDEDVLCEYIDLIIEGMETGNYRYVAHPDLLHFTGSHEIYKEHMTKLCRYLKDKNVPVEINMLGLYEKRHYPSDRFFKIAEEVGNSAIIGIDAHQPERLEFLDVQKQCEYFAKKYHLPLVKVLKGLE